MSKLLVFVFPLPEAWRRLLRFRNTDWRVQFHVRLFGSRNQTHDDVLRLPSRLRRLNESWLLIFIATNDECAPALKHRMSPTRFIYLFIWYIFFFSLTYFISLTFRCLFLSSSLFLSTTATFTMINSRFFLSYVTYSTCLTTLIRHVTPFKSFVFFYTLFKRFLRAL